MDDLICVSTTHTPCIYLICASTTHTSFGFTWYASVPQTPSGYLLDMRVHHTHPPDLLNMRLHHTHHPDLLDMRLHHTHPPDSRHYYYYYYVYENVFSVALNTGVTKIIQRNWMRSESQDLFTVVLLILLILITSISVTSDPRRTLRDWLTRVYSCIFNVYVWVCVCVCVCVYGCVCVCDAGIRFCDWYILILYAYCSVYILTLFSRFQSLLIMRYEKWNGIQTFNNIDHFYVWTTWVTQKVRERKRELCFQIITFTE